jgi:hypothetical protein
MDARLLRAALPAVLACTFGLRDACADIYTWTDAAGNVNISNLTPPEGAKVTSVMHEPPPRMPPPPGPAVDSARQAEMQMLAERVRELEFEVELARRQAPPPVTYPVAYPSVPPPQPVQYSVDPTPPPDYGYGCDPGWSSCGLGWGSGFYPGSVIVVGAPGFRRPFASRGGPHYPMQRPVHPPPHPPMHGQVAFNRR